MTEEAVMTEICDIPAEPDGDNVIPEAEKIREIQPEDTDVPSDGDNLENTRDDGDSIQALNDEILSLRQKIAELEAERDTQARIMREIGDFSSLFPDVELELIPESVWDSVRKGTPLMASYALYEKRMMAEEARIAKINASNASRSAGVAGKDAAGEYFSPDEVRRMSPSEVHANYSKIKESMKKWI